jgi:hypothetical protein
MELGLGVLYWVGWLVVVGLLVYEHSLVSATDLSRLDMAFFNVNGYISVITFVAAVAGLRRVCQSRGGLRRLEGRGARAGSPMGVGAVLRWGSLLATSLGAGLREHRTLPGRWAVFPGAGDARVAHRAALRPDEGS